MNRRSRAVIGAGTYISIFALGVITSTNVLPIIAGLFGVSVQEAAIGWYIFGLGLIIGGWVSAQ